MAETQLTHTHTHTHTPPGPSSALVDGVLIERRRPNLLPKYAPTEDMRKLVRAVRHDLPCGDDVSLNLSLLNFRYQLVSVFFIQVLP